MAVVANANVHACTDTDVAHNLPKQGAYSSVVLSSVGKVLQRKGK